MTGYPVSLNGRTTQKKSNWNITKDRYGKPVLTPIWGADVTESRCIDVVKPSMMTTAEGQTPRNETILKTSWPKEMDNNRFEKPVQPPVRGANMTLPDQVTVKERREKTAAECLMPLNGVTIDRSWHKVMNSNRNEKPLRTQVLRTVVRESDCAEIKRGLKTVEADWCVDRDDEVRPDSGQAAALTTGGIGTGATNNRCGRCTDCNKKTMTFGRVQTNGGNLRKPLSGLLPPVVNKLTPTDGTGAMHYQWIVRESIKMTEMKMPSNYLEIPELKISKLFLDLAEEARNVEVNNDLSGCSEEVKSQVTGLPSPILVTVMTDGQPIPIGYELANDVVSAEMMNNAKYVGRCTPIDRANQVVSPGTTRQPIRLGLNTGGRRTASADTGGPDINSDERREPVDGLEPVVLLGSEMCENETAPVVPVGHDVNLMGHDRPVDRSGPVGTQSMTEQSALLALKTDGMENAAVGPDGNSSGRGEPGDRSDPAGSRSGTDRPVLTDKGGDAPNCPMGLEVLLDGRRKMLDRPDPVGPHRSMEQSVFLRLDVDQVSANIVHPGVEMFRIQPVADGLAGSDRGRCPVGTDGRHAVHDEVRPTAGGPVGRFPDPGPLKYSKMSSPDDSYQPLVTGPLGTNEMNAINDPGRPTAGGPLGRPFSLDPMGPRAMLSLGDGNQPPSVGPVGRLWIPERPGDQVTEPDYTRTTQTRSESESDTGAPDSVIQTGSEVQTDRVNISTDNGLTSSRETSPSSDSGVHSWTEQWENMSENLTYSSWYHTVGSHREDSGRVSQLEFRAPPNTEDEDDSDYPDTDGMLAKKLGGCPSEGMYGKNGRIPYSAVTGGGSERNADIAALSDFSDDSSELGVGQQLECRTPVPVQPILPPVKARSWAEELLLDEDSTSSTWSRWDYGTLPEMTDPEFTREYNARGIGERCGSPSG